MIFARKKGSQDSLNKANIETNILDQNDLLEVKLYNVAM